MNPTVAKYRKFAIAGYICAIVSLFFGGALLAVIGFILSHTAYRKLKPIVEANPEDRFAFAVRRMAKNAFIICAGAAILNFFTAATLLPQIMDSMGMGSASSTAATTGIF